MVAPAGSSTTDRRVTDRILLLALGLSAVILLATIAVAVLSYVNPSVPPVAVPIASSR